MLKGSKRLAAAAFGLCLSASMQVHAAEMIAPEDATRAEYNINREWRFKPGDEKGAEAVSFDDSKWERTHIPHSFSMPYFLSTRFYTGYGWYRKTLSVKKIEHARYFLDFKGVFQVAEVYVNGKPAGKHSGGYTGFEVDVTNFLTDGANTISVRVNNLWDPRLAPRAGEHVFAGGIYRDVSLIVKNDVHVAWYGMSITTPKLEQDDTSVSVVNEVYNASGRTREITVKTEIQDDAGNVLTMAQKRGIKLSPNSLLQVELLTPPVKGVRRWSPETPVVYQAVTTISEAGKELDRASDTFGFRTIRWTADQGFFLNGKNIYLRGANVHQDRAGWGDAATVAGFERDLRYMKTAGMSVIRGSHYPHHPEFAKICDKIGLMFWCENCFWGTGGMGAGKGLDWGCASAYPVETADRIPFEESVIRSLRDMIRINRNRPSIICWSLCNEPFFSDQLVMPNVQDFLRRLTKIAHEADPTRMAAVGGCQRGGIDKCSDIAGYNGDGERIAEYQNPGIPNLVTEYGSPTIELRPGKYTPGFEPGTQLTGKREYAWRSGEIIWCGIDHGSVGGQFGWQGMMDYFRLPKRRWYYYRETLGGVKHPEWPVEGTPAKLIFSADKPVIEHADGTDDVQLTAVVVDRDGRELSNSPDVVFRVISGPGEFPTGRSITFTNQSDIAIRDGKCSIDFRSYYAGETVIEAVSEGLPPARISIVSKNAPVFSPDSSVVIENRPYKKFEGELNIVKNAVPLDVALNKPTMASESVPGHSAVCAVDGNPGTYYLAVSSKNCSFQVTPERIIKPEAIRVVFHKKAVWRYRLECSVNPEQWTLIADESDSQTITQEKSFPLNGKYEGLYFRLVFVDGGEAPGISDFSILL